MLSKCAIYNAKKSRFIKERDFMEFKHLARTASNTVLRDKAFNIAKNPTYDGYQRALQVVVLKIKLNKMIN